MQLRIRKVLGKYSLVGLSGRSDATHKIIQHSSRSEELSRRCQICREFCAHSVLDDLKRSQKVRRDALLSVRFERRRRKSVLYAGGCLKFLPKRQSRQIRYACPFVLVVPVVAPVCSTNIQPREFIRLGNMMRAWDGTLSAAEFEKAAVHLVKVWEQQCPNSPPWTWQRRQPNPVISPLAHVVGYLELQDVHLNPKDKGTEILDNSQDVDEDEDPATMHPDIVGEEEHCYTYHVIYNESYRVPMLFLHGCLRDGRLLQWQDVLQDLPLGSQHLTGESRWTFLTQEDHPFLHRPWFALHPCGTSNIMSLVYTDQCLPKCEVGSSSTEDSHKTSVTSNSRQDQSTLCGEGAFLEENEGAKTAGGQRGGWMEKYILTWVSFACPAVGVKIPLRFLAENM